MSWVSSTQPVLDNTQTVNVELIKDGKRVAGAQVYSVVHCRDSDFRWPEEGFEVTQEDGIASIPFVVTAACAQDAVRIDVYLIHEGNTLHSVTSLELWC
jgi:hypothetical protein